MKLFILWLDAIAPGQITKKTTPFLYGLSQKYRSGRYYSDFGFSSALSGLLTGKSPNEHQQLFVYNPSSSPRSWLSRFPQRSANLTRFALGQTNFAPQLKGIFRGSYAPSPSRYYHHAHALPIPTIFDYCRTHQLNFTVYNWPLWGDVRKTTLTPFVSPSDRARANYFLSHCQKTADLAFFHLWDLDHHSHQYGLSSPQTKQALQEYDLVTEKLFTNLHPSNFLIWSDHGMVPVSKVIDPNKEFPLALASHYFVDSTTLRTWFASDTSFKKFEKTPKPFGRFLSSRDQTKYHLDHLCSVVFDSLFVLKPGCLFSPSSFEDNPNLKSMHGYLPDELGASERPLYISSLSLHTNPTLRDFYTPLLQSLS